MTPDYPFELYLTTLCELLQVTKLRIAHVAFLIGYDESNLAKVVHETHKPSATLYERIAIVTNFIGQQELDIKLSISRKLYETNAKYKERKKEYLEDLKRRFELFYITETESQPHQG